MEVHHESHLDSPLPIVPVDSDVSVWTINTATVATDNK